MNQSVLAAGTLLCVALAASAEDLVPFVIPERVHPESLIAIPDGPPIYPDGPRVVVRDGHFFRDGRRVRIWGVNLCFGACFPSRADAPHVARRLAAAGINSVRFHHMDNSAFPRGIGDPKDPMKLSAEALDRLDFFIDQLARRGIYANVNLHVSRTHSRYLRLPDADKLRGYDKIADLFTPELIDAQKRYARDLLTHVNPYRKVRYADDPAVAFVEINNEDSLFMWGADDTLRSLPPHYAGLLRRLYADWLKGRYGGEAGVRAAWSAGAVPLGEDLTADPTFRTMAGGGGQAKWHLMGHAGCAATAAATPAGRRLTIDKADDTGWHIQLTQGGLKLKAGGYYTLTFRVRADAPRAISFNVMQDHEPWRILGLNRAADVGKEWTTFREGFTASADDDNARVTFQFGGSKVPVEIADVRLRPGGREGLRDGESIEDATVAVFADSATDARTLDRWRFLAQTEKAYFDGMKAFVQKDLGCKALVTGTIVFGPLGLYGQSDMDYIDGHAYWQHPHFPGRPWDPGNWTIEQKAMVDHPDQSTLFRLAAQRLEGKPYTVSEYNHPAPNDFQAECVPMIATYAASQDWDGVWLFAYSHAADDWSHDAIRGFFDMDHNPAKWGFVPAGTVLFRQGGMQPREGGMVFPLARTPDILSDLAKLQMRHGGNMAAAVCELWDIEQGRLLLQPSAVAIRSGPVPVTGGPTARPPAWGMNRQTGRRWLRCVVPAAGVWVGFAGQDEAPVLGLKTSFAAVAAVPLDGKELDKTSKVLVTALGRCENTGMKFSADRRTVGRDWGSAPVRIEPVEGVLAVVLLGGKGWRCQALGPDGRAVSDVPVAPADEDDGTGATLKMSPKYKTMWYLLTRE